MQTYTHWELLLVDDGSSDSSRAIAERYARQHSDKVRVLAHPGNQNRGMAATRNLGITLATGKYVAFLDADDLWLKRKLDEQVPILEAHEEVDMIYGETLYWHSWTGGAQAAKRDFKPSLRVPLSTPIRPPQLLPLFLQGKAAVPCTCSILIRHSLFEHIGGFEASFAVVDSLYEDQSFYAKVCLNAQVLVIDSCLDLYRQHTKASTAVARETGQAFVARAFFLRWLEQYMLQHGLEDAAVWRALRREQWRLRRPAWLPTDRRVLEGAFWTKKWLLRLEECLLPTGVSRRLWERF